MSRFHRDVLKLDTKAEAERIVERLRHNVFDALRRKGGVLGVSGGIDSAVVLALATQALGTERLVTLLLPERESSPESVVLARQLCRQFGVEPLVEDVTGPLMGFGCYSRRDALLRSMFSEYDGTYLMKIALPDGLLESGTLNFFRVTIVSPEGEERTRRLSADQVRQIVAATNFKQRVRMSMLYYHAELHDYAVLGTPPKNEHDMGFFVKHGDGAMDVRPMVHLYKSQIYQLAEYLDIPEDIRTRPPTSDTYSAGSTQEEFFFRLPHQTLDLLWYGWENGFSAAEVAEELELSEDQVNRAYQDFHRKKQTTEFLRRPPLGTPEENGTGIGFDSAEPMLAAKAASP